MSADLHAAIRTAVRDHVVAGGMSTEAGIVFDATEVADALIEVLAEVIVSGPPDHRWSFVASIHSALDQAVVTKASISQVAYPVLPS
ncbi:hypothetical protein [Ancylobacter polymorphus]|uniref:Uncharacterized protein n=1 Tax=Ancylobacter polymorphus TaxID=223390 RepID=A0ABU0B6G9_9HYPH|nr:hypothetical protein [Ancylobacter polymorphus]MDQ0301413.1 hypothetical protein [Ancylobacter polymorphus]